MKLAGFACLIFLLLAGCVADTGSADTLRHVAVDCVVERDGKILMEERQSGLFEGYWVLPGGHVERDETVEAAAVRETKEETGLDVKAIKMVGVFSDPDRDPRGTVSVVFLCAVTGGQEKTQPAEVRHLQWFPWEKLPDNIGFDHAEILAAVKENPL